MGRTFVLLVVAVFILCTVSYFRDNFHLLSWWKVGDKELGVWLKESLFRRALLFWVTFSLVTTFLGTFCYTWWLDYYQGNFYKAALVFDIIETITFQVVSLTMYHFSKQGSDMFMNKYQWAGLVICLIGTCIVIFMGDE